MNEQGMALLPIILIFMLIGVLIGIGFSLFGPSIKRGKITDTRNSLEAATLAVISWSAANGRLPKDTEFPGVVNNPNDAFGKPLVYLYDINLTDNATGGLCGRTSTTLSTTGTSIITNVAFIILSGGDDYKVDTNPGTSQASSGTVTLPQTDLTRAVHIEELKNRAGCYSNTGGRLMIVNNELPRACSGAATYNAAVYVVGGVPGYTWATNPLFPTSWLAAPTLSSDNGSLYLSASDNISNSQTITFTVTDSSGNTAQKVFTINVISCTGGG